MQKSFNDFYTATSFEQATDPNVLSELRRTLLDLEVFTEDEVEQFNELFHRGAEPGRSRANTRPCTGSLR